MSQRYRQASRNDMVEGRGYILTLSRVLAESGITAEERQRNSIDRVRQALKELKQQGFLHPMKAYDERPIYERTKGRPKIVEMEWKLYPSSTFVGEIVEGNIEMKSVKEGAGGAKARRLRWSLPSTLATSWLWPQTLNCTLGWWCCGSPG